MHIKPMLAIPICLFSVFVFWITGSSGLTVPNLTEQCYECLCNVSSECDLENGCNKGYCGPFAISRIYWADAGRIVLPDDDPKRTDAWSDCARNYDCAKKIIEVYLQKYGQEKECTNPTYSANNANTLYTADDVVSTEDCNNDGETNCFDYMMVNGNGGYLCDAPLNRSANGRRWLKRYEDCKL